MCGLFLVAEELQTDRHEDAAQTDGLGEFKGHQPVREGTSPPRSPCPHQDTSSEKRHPPVGWGVGGSQHGHCPGRTTRSCGNRRLSCQVVPLSGRSLPGCQGSPWAVTPRVYPALPRFQRQLPSGSTHLTLGTHVHRTKMG